MEFILMFVIVGLWWALARARTSARQAQEQADAWRSEALGLESQSVRPLSVRIEGH